MDFCACAAAIIRSTFSSLASARDSSPTTLPSAITSERSARPITSSSSEETTISPTPGLGEIDDQPVDLVARADVDALGRLVEQEDLRRVHQHAREQELLLVAAGEMRDGGRRTSAP